MARDGPLVGARLRTGSPLAPVVAATAGCAGLVGVASGYDPRLGVALAAGLVLAALFFADLLLGFAAMVLFGYLEAYSVFGEVSIAKAAGAVVLVSWLAALTVGGRRTRNLFAERPGLTYLLALFLGWAVISITWARVQPDAVESVERYALNVVLLPIAYAAVHGSRDLVRVLAVVVVGACIAAASGLAVGADASEASADGITRAGGTVGDPNELAAALVVGIAVAAAFAVNRHVAPPLRLLSLGAVVLCLAGVLATLSRGGLLGMATALVLAVVLGGRWRGRMLAGAAVVAVLAVGWFSLFAALPATERVLHVGGGTGRMDLWTVAERMIEANPVRGVGTGQFASASVSYLLRPGAIQRGDFILSSPKVAHNTYLNATAELGLVGGLLFGAIVLTCVASVGLAIRELRRAGDERLEILVRGLAVGLGGYLVALLFISENYSKLMWALFALGPACLAVARARARGPAR